MSFGTTTNAFAFGGLKPAASASPFGASPAVAPSSSLFGGTSHGGGPFGAGGGLFPQQQQQQQQQEQPFTGDTNFSALPQYMQMKVWELHKLVKEHREHAETVNKFSTQSYALDQHTKKLKLHILRVRNAHAEISLLSDELRTQVERLRGFIQKLQAAENGALQYSIPRAAGIEHWQQRQDSHTDILREMVGQCEARLQEYGVHIQELYRKVVPSRGTGDEAREGRDEFSRQVTPDQLATLIRLQNDALLKVAAQVAGMHEMVERLRSEWNSRTGQDPFEELDRVNAENEEQKRKMTRMVIRSSQESLTQESLTSFQVGNSASLIPASFVQRASANIAAPSPFTYSIDGPTTAVAGTDTLTTSPFGYPAPDSIDRTGRSTKAKSRR